MLAPDLQAFEGVRMAVLGPADLVGEHEHCRLSRPVHRFRVRVCVCRAVTDLLFSTVDEGLPVQRSRLTEC